MDSDKESPIKPISPEANPVEPISPKTAPPVEFSPSPEAQPAPQHEETEVVVEDGKVYQMPAHDDPNDNAAAQAQRLAPLPEEEKLWQLKLIARDKSLEKAVEVVKKMDDPWLEDKFHDDLMDDPEWRQQLEALGKIEKL